MNDAKFPEIRIEENGKKSIYDALRQRFVTLTPEEGVRQGFIHYLIHEKHYPQAFLANEVSITLNGTHKRCDSVLYNQFLQPKMIIEYKAPHINLSQKTFNQIIRYNIVLHVEYLVITNSKTTFTCKINKENNSVSILSEIPDYSDL